MGGWRSDQGPRRELAVRGREWARRGALALPAPQHHLLALSPVALLDRGARGDEPGRQVADALARQDARLRTLPRAWHMAAEEPARAERARPLDGRLHAAARSPAR